MSAERAESIVEQNPWQTWREGVKDGQPSIYGKGTVVDVGLMFKKDGKTLYHWQSATDSLDKMQLERVDDGYKAYRAYRFQVDQGSRFPSAVLTCNAIATQKQGWTARLNVGERADLYAWNDGKFTQVAFKKVEG